MLAGGQPLFMLDQIRRDYPLVMHGVALSIGALNTPSIAYLRALKDLIQRVEPLWVSDHLCWTGAHGMYLHDLLPLPYTEESMQIVVRNIKFVQDYLERPLVLENVSSYARFTCDTISEWAFIAAIAEASDSLILLDVNNLYVNSINHGFDAQEFLNAIPIDRVQQIHLAGHSDHGTHLIDTHDHPVAAPVWALYADAVRRFGPVATMIERDDNIPSLTVLEAELHQARTIAAEVGKRQTT